MGYVYRGTMTDLGYGRGWMNDPAAASQRRMDRALGHPQQITEAGRTWDQQNAHYQNYLRNGYPIALSPDAPSLHQMGNAKDTDERPVALHNDHGWYHTVYRWVNGVWTLVEPWHFEYFPERDNHRNEPAGGEEEMNAEQEAILRNIAAFLYGGGPSLTNPSYFGAPGTIYNRILNIQGFLYDGGTSASDPAYVGAVGTVYNMLKDPNSPEKEAFAQMIVDAVIEALSGEVEEPDDPKA